MKRVSFYTLGCKLNQAETSQLMNELHANGFEIVPFGDGCDLCVINTCVVTGRTEQKCRHIIRKAKASSPNAKIAVVGCYSQIFPSKLREIDGIQWILGSDEKFDLLRYLNDDAAEALSQHDRFRGASTGEIHHQTRAFLKIQDGCDNQCSYCIVPLARGRSRSQNLKTIIDDIRKLNLSGYQEIVLTGVHIGAYGNDLLPQEKLLTLLKKIEKIPDIGRIRLSSLEPMEIGQELIDWIAGSSKICKHFHIPLQSGDDEILKRMRRNYRTSDYLHVIENIIDKIPDAGLGTDVIVGFPGETENHFNHTHQFVRDLPFSYLHVFSFSPRNGTEAFRFMDRVEPQTKKQRSKILLELGKQKKTTFYGKFIGKKCDVLFENREINGWMYGFSDNYIRVKVTNRTDLYNRIVRTEINDVQRDISVGEIAA